MYRHGNYSGTPSTSTSTSTNQLSYNFPADFLTHFPQPDVIAPPSIFQPTPCFPPSPLVIPAYNDLDSMAALKSEFGNTSSGCSSYDSPGSYTSFNETQYHTPSVMQRSVSSHSLIQKKVNESFHQLVSSPTTEFFDSESSSVRRVYSAGDLQGVNIGQHSHRSESPLSNESTSIIESMSKASPYSPEVKKERIEKYRSKRNQRNFNKKIKYECRKTLADSRPRIRGRFARNDEIEKASQNQWNNQAGIEEYFDEEDDNWINLLDSFAANLIP